MKRSKAKVMCGIIIPALIQLFKRKRLLVDTLTIRLKCIRNTLNIHITLEDIDSKVIVIDTVNKHEKIFRIDLNNSIENLLFLLSLIRDEYNSKILFTDKSHIV